MMVSAIKYTYDAIYMMDPTCQVVKHSHDYHQCLGKTC